MTDVAVLAWRQYRLERRLFWRNPSAAFFNFLLPLLFLAFFGAIFGGNQHDLNVIVPGIAGMSVMSTTFTALAFNMTFLREQGVLKRIRGTPMPASSYLLGIAGEARDASGEGFPALKARGESGETGCDLESGRLGAAGGRGQLAQVGPGGLDGGRAVAEAGDPALGPPLLALGEDLLQRAPHQIERHPLLVPPPGHLPELESRTRLRLRALCCGARLRWRADGSPMRTRVSESGRGR